MKAVDIKTINARAKRAATRGRRFAFSVLSLSLLGLGSLAVIAYIMFFSGWFSIRDVAIEGLSQDHATQVRGIIESNISRSVLHIPIGKNIFLFKNKSISHGLSDNLKYIQQISIKKDFFHALIVEAQERQPLGVWCFGSTSSPQVSPTTCHYFDEDGNTWGTPVRSTGYLLLNVDDNVRGEANGIDPKFLTAIKTINQGLSEQKIQIKNITIPTETYAELDVTIAGGYVLKFSTDSDIFNQLGVFEVFYDQQIKPQLIHPAYIDLRYPDRVYYH